PPSGGTAPASRQGNVLRLVRNTPRDANPLLIDAHSIHTLDEDGQGVLWLPGPVLVQQSVSKTRFQEGVAWIDLKRYRSTGILHVEILAEGSVRIETGLENQEGARALLDLNTRGEFRLRAHRSKVVKQD